ncbi:MAG: hypothetical protein EPN23_06175 [Verrucomicrobia bacterium]|nr:MAG: hypothetical protein EPN23_06175 [Verrucomicrobiota bacterium]
MANMIFKSDVEWTGTGLQSDAVIRMDEPEALGGTDTGQNPVESILAALGGCMVVLVKAFVPAHQKLQVESASDPASVRDLIAHVESSCPVKDAPSGAPVVRAGST